MATTTAPGISTVSAVRRTHPHLIARAQAARPDTLFVVLLLAAVLLCAIVPLALL